MKKLGAYIGDSYSGLEKNTFVWYEVFRCLDDMYGNDVYDVSFWSIKGGYPNGRKPDVKFKTTKHLIDITIVPMKELANRYCIEWENQQWQIKDCTVLGDYYRGYEYISTLKVDQFGSNNYSHWEWGGDQALSVLKDAKVNRVYEPTPTIPKTLKEELKKSLEQDVMKSALNSYYGMGGFTTANSYISNRILSVNEALEIWENKNKETKTMEKKKMTDTDRFMRNNNISITSTHARMNKSDDSPYDIYYPEMEITPSVAENLITVLLLMRNAFVHKLIFNPNKGTTTIKLRCQSVTVRCNEADDAEFNFVMGFVMANMKREFGSDDYNWFNKIKNHRKTHIEYTEKKPTKKGGKK